MSRAQRVVLTLWVAFGLFVSARTVLRPYSHTVFPVYVATVEQWWNNDNIYLKCGNLDYFRYPPVAAVVLTPFGLLGPVYGGVLWIWVSLGVYASGLRRLQRDVLPGDWTAERQAWFFALALVGAASGLANGQSNALIAGLMLHGCAALARQRWWTAAVWLGSAVGLKMLPLPIVLLCAARWPRLIPRLAVVIGVALALPFLTAPPGYVWSMYGALADQSRALAGERWPGFRDAWTTWLIVSEGRWGYLPDLRQPIDSVAYRVLQLATALGVFGVTLHSSFPWGRFPTCHSFVGTGFQPVRPARWGWVLNSLMHHGPLGRSNGRLETCPTEESRRARHTLTAILGLGGAWLMLFGPASEHPTFVFLAPLLAWAYAQRQPHNPIIVAAAVLAFVVTWIGPALGLTTTIPWLLLALPLGCLLFAVWLLRWLSGPLLQSTP